MLTKVLSIATTALLAVTVGFAGGLEETHGKDGNGEKLFSAEPVEKAVVDGSSSSAAIPDELEEKAGYSGMEDDAASDKTQGTEVGDDGSIDEAYDETRYSSDDLRYSGVIYHGGWTYTWYSESELPGEGLYIPGRHHEDGFIMDDYGNICVACCDYARGTQIAVPFANGTAIVYDYCPTSGIIDVYLP